MAFPFLALGLSAGKSLTSYLQNEKLKAKYEAFVKQRQRQTDIQVQNLSSKVAATQGRVTASFSTTGGSLESGTLRDLQSANLIQASRQQFAFEQQEAFDLQSAADSVGSQMTSPFLEGFSTFIEAGGFESIGGIEGTESIGDPIAEGDFFLPDDPLQSPLGGFA